MTDVHEAPVTDAASSDGDRPHVHDLRSAPELLR
jgi:hypothetical protein